MAKIKIALLMNAFWANGKGTSGGDQRIIQIFKRISPFFDIDIYTSRDGKDLVANSIDGANFIISPSNFDHINLLKSYYLKTRWTSKKLLEKNYDVIYSSSDFFPDVIPANLYISRTKKTRWIQLIHHIYPNWYKRPGNKIKNLVAKVLQDLSFSYIKKNANNIITVSEEVRNQLVEKGFFSEKIIVNHNGIDTGFFDSFNIKKIKNSACFLARLNPSKGIFDLVSIWAQVVKKIPSAKLEIIGSGSPEIIKRMKDEIKEENLNDSIKMHGFLPDDQAHEILAKSEIFISASHEEGFGMAIGEAMASRCAVVSWDLPVYKTVFGDETIQIPEHDKNAFAKTIIDLFGDQKQISKRAFSGYNYIKKYNWDNIAEKEYQFIKNTHEK